MFSLILETQARKQTIKAFVNRGKRLLFTFQPGPENDDAQEIAAATCISVADLKAHSKTSVNTSQPPVYEERHDTQNSDLQ